MLGVPGYEQRRPSLPSSQRACRRRQQAKTGQEGAKSSQAIQQMVGQRGRGRRSHATNMARAARTNMARGLNQAEANSMRAPGLGSGDTVPQELALPSLSSSPCLHAFRRSTFHSHLSFPLFAALWRWRTRRGTAWRRSSTWAPSRRSRSVPGQLPLTTTMDDGSAVRARTCKSLSWCHGIQLLSRCCLHRSMSSADRSLDIAIDASVVVHRRTYRSDHPHLSPHSAAEAAPNWPCTFPA